MKIVLLFVSFVVSVFFIGGCKELKQESKEVVVYTSLDKVFSEPVLEEFEKQTGIKVKAVYDSEATKTTGLVNRLIAEKNAPKADVFWNSETGRTALVSAGIFWSFWHLQLECEKASS